MTGHHSTPTVNHSVGSLGLDMGGFCWPCSLVFMDNIYGSRWIKFLLVKYIGSSSLKSLFCFSVFTNVIYSSEGKTKIVSVMNPVFNAT